MLYFVCMCVVCVCVCKSVLCKSVLCVRVCVVHVCVFVGVVSLVCGFSFVILISCMLNYIIYVYTQLPASTITSQGLLYTTTNHSVPSMYCGWRWKNTERCPPN